MDTGFDSASEEDKVHIKTLDAYLQAAEETKAAWQRVFDEKDNVYSPREEAALLLQAAWDGGERPASLKALFYAQVATLQRKRDVMAGLMAAKLPVYERLLSAVHFPTEKMTALIEQHAKSDARYRQVKTLMESTTPTPDTQQQAYHIMTHVADYRQTLKMLNIPIGQFALPALAHLQATPARLGTLTAAEKALATHFSTYFEAKTAAREQWREIATLKKTKQPVLPAQYDAATTLTTTRNAAAFAIARDEKSVATFFDKTGLQFMQPDKWCLNHATEHLHLQTVEQFIATATLPDKHKIATDLLREFATYRRALRQHDMGAIELTHTAWQHQKIALLVNATAPEKKWIAAVDAYLAANTQTRHAWAAISDTEASGDKVTRADKNAAFAITNARNTAAMALMDTPERCQQVWAQLLPMVQQRIKTHAQKALARLEQNAGYAIAEQTGDWDYQARFEHEIRDTVPTASRPAVTVERTHYDKQAVLDAVNAHPEAVLSLILGKQPNPKLSKGNQLVWGDKGSVRYCLRGSKAGLVSDFEQSKFGDVIHYYAQITGKVWKDALVDVAKMANVLPGTVAVELSPAQKASQARTQAANEKKALTKIRRMRQYGIDGWNTGVAIKGTLAETYLTQHRKINTEVSGFAFRYQPRMKDFGDTPNITRPALLVQAKNNAGKMMTTQAIYLDPATGNKAALDVAKRSFGPAEGQAALVYAGGGNRIIIAEGPETCASIAAIAPTANIYSSLGRARTIGHYAYLCQRHNTSKILIAADNDDVAPTSTTWRDIKAAAIELSEAGVEVSIAKPVAIQVIKDGYKQTIKTDFNDLLQHGGDAFVRENLRPNYKVLPVDEAAIGDVERAVVHVDRNTGEVAVPEKQAPIIDDAPLLGTVDKHHKHKEALDVTLEKPQKDEYDVKLDF